jgi:hypothetical protein
LKLARLPVDATNRLSSSETAMTNSTRQLILRANAIFLLAASSWGMCMDLLGAFALVGPQAKIVGAAPYSTIGFFEAHGLAFIIGVRLWFAEPVRTWHLTAAAVHVLLGASNLVFWQIFVVADMLAGGYLTTSLHWLFVALQLAAAANANAKVRATGAV